MVPDAHDWVSQVLETPRSALCVSNVCLGAEHMQINIKLLH